MAVANPTVTFKDIPGFPGYRVGDDGSVWSCRKRGPGSFGSDGNPTLTSKWRQLVPIKHSGGYLAIALTQGQKQTARIYIHRLVLTAFVGECPVGMQACHYDGNKTNNHLANLRWDTPKANQADRTRHGTGYFGESHFSAKLTAELIKQIRKDRDCGMTFKALAEKYHICTTTARRITIRQTWKQVPNSEEATSSP